MHMSVTNPRAARAPNGCGNDRNEIGHRGARIERRAERPARPGIDPRFSGPQKRRGLALRHLDGAVGRDVEIEHVYRADVGRTHGRARGSRRVCWTRGSSAICQYSSKVPHWSWVAALEPVEHLRRRPWSEVSGAPGRRHLDRAPTEALHESGYKG